MGWPARRQGRRARRGVALVEFAFAATVAVPLALATYDLANAFAAWRKVTQAVQAVGEIGSAMAANMDNSNTLSLGQADAATTAVFAYLPALRTAAAADWGVALSSVVFEPSGKACRQAGANANHFCARLAWSRTFQGAMPVARACAGDASQYSLAPVNDAEGSPAPGQLPAGLYTAAPLLVVDLAYTFKPVTLQFIRQGIVMRRSAYYPMRTGTNDRWLRYTDPAGGSARCPGYA